MVKYHYIVVYETAINVNTIKRQPGEKFVEEETQELKNMTKQNYLMRIKKYEKPKIDKQIYL